MWQRARAQLERAYAAFHIIVVLDHQTFKEKTNTSIVPVIDILHDSPYYLFDLSPVKRNLVVERRESIWYKPQPN
jgi:hypothetical protein